MFTLDVEARRVLTTRGQSRLVGVEYPLGRKFRTYIRKHWVAAASSSQSDKLEFIPLESGAGSGIAGLFTVKSGATAEARRRLRKVGRENELDNALRRRNRIRL